MNQEIDLLKKVEDLTARLNQLFGEKGKSIFGRYPLTFALFIIVGATMVSQGIKELLLEIPIIKDSPFIMLGIGLIILIITGTLYKKLKK